MRSFLSANGFEPNDQAIVVHINADHLLRNRQAAVVRMYAAGTWLVTLGGMMHIQRFGNGIFDVGCGNAGNRSDRYRLGLSVEMRQRDVIAVANSSFGGVGWDHAVARVVVQQAGQEMVGFGFTVISVGPLIGEFLLNCIKKLSVQDRGLLAGQDFTLIIDLADIEPVAQQIEKRAAAERDAATGRTSYTQSGFGSDIP